jgi:hypothetical protein
MPVLLEVWRDLWYETEQQPSDPISSEQLPSEPQPYESPLDPLQLGPEDWPESDTEQRQNVRASRDVDESSEPDNRANGTSTSAVRQR